ncbi:MAG: branched-chain amino acid ABC transporter permease [Pseudomonadota bacterium]
MMISNKTMLDNPLKVLIPIATLLLMLALYAIFGGYFARELVTEIAILSILALSLDMIAGYGGMISLCHGAILGLGAYMYGALSTLLHIHPLGAAALAVISGVMYGLIVDAIVAKTSGIFFIMATLAFGQMLYIIIFDSQFLGGDDGLWGIERIDLSALGINSGDSLSFALIALSCAMICAIKITILLHSSFGHSLVGIRENESRMQAIGISLWRLKSASFGISGGFAAFAGVLAAQHTMFISPDLLEWTSSGEALVVVILGGLGSVVGAVAGAIAFVFLKSSISAFTHYWHLIVGLVLIATVLSGQQGLVGLFRYLYQWVVAKKNIHTNQSSSS